MTQELARLLIQPGVQFKIPGNKQRSSLSGEVLAVKKVNFTYRCFYMDMHEMILTHRLDDIAGIQAAMIYPRGSKL